VRRPTLVAPSEALSPSMPQPASIGRSVLSADRARIRRAVRERRRAESAEVRRFTRGARRRRLVALVAASFLVVSVGTPVALAVSPAFAVRAIQVSGADPALAAEVRAAAAPDLGTPIALVDGGALSARIAAVAGVERFSVARIPPGTLAVQVVPRTGVAQVEADGGYRLVDAAGVVLQRSASRLAGVPLVHATPGSATFDAAAAVLAALPGWLAPQVVSVGAATPAAVVLHLADGRLVAWGAPGSTAAKAVALRAAMRSVGRHAHEIDVSVPGSVAIR